MNMLPVGPSLDQPADALGFARDLLALVCDCLAQRSDRPFELSPAGASGLYAVLTLADQALGAVPSLEGGNS